MNIRNNPFKTKSDLQDAVIQMCESLKPYYSEGGAQLDLGATGAFYNRRTILMEAFSRPLWGLAPLNAGGREYDIWDIYVKGIITGTDPKSKEYWGVLRENHQVMVEMAALGYALALAPDKVWDPLTPEQKRNFSDWMDQINHRKVNDNNWLFFLVLVNIGLKKVGQPYNQEAMDRCLKRLDEFYLSDGWYKDGDREQRDYYIPFAMHFYGLIYAGLMEKDDPERSALYKERAKRFAQDFIYWFSADGPALPFGRSLTYRFAHSAFWGALAFAGVEAFPWGVIKGIVLRNMRWWFKQPIFTKEGILTIGYTYPNLIMGEGYNAPGSPYWSLKAFIPLALDDNHPFWKAEEEPLPKLSRYSVQQHPHMILCRDDSGKHVWALTSGQHAAFEPAHTAAKYEKFAYSTVFGFSVPKGDFGLNQGAYDSMLALSEGDGLYRVRRNCEKYEIKNNYIYSLWKPMKEVEVETWLVPAGSWHVRIHRVNTARSLDTAEAGFAIAMEKALAEITEDNINYSDRGVIISSPWGLSGILDLNGERKASLIIAEPNTNLLHPETYIPTIKGHLEPGTHWLAAAAAGCGEWDKGEINEATAPSVAIDDTKLVVKDADGNVIISIIHQ